MVTSIGIVIILQFISRESITRKGRFERKFTSSQPVLLHSKMIHGLRAVSGIENNRIYFETDTVGSIVQTDTTLSDLQLISYPISMKNSFQSLYSTFMDSSYCYITGGNIPAITRFDRKDLSSQFFHFPHLLFSQAVIADHGTFILRAYQKFNDQYDQIFTTWNPVTRTLITRDHILEKRGDAGISTDGILLFDNSASRVLFVRYYSNTFICMDTALKITYRANTIDSTESIPIKVAVETSPYSQIMTNSSPLTPVNHLANAENNKLYIQSAVQADNESSKAFSTNAAIDVYETGGSNYIGSFYIPKYKSEKLKDFKINGNIIIALYNDYAAIYSLPFNF